MDTPLARDMHLDGVGGHPALPVPPVLYKVVAVTPVGGTTLHIEFNDGLRGDLDMDLHMTWHGVFAPLRADPALFAQVFVDATCGCVTWPGELDIDSEALHARLLWAMSQANVSPAAATP